ncbi:MAG TPA: glutathione S-transferase family protein [Steroidobacteraceae bacterium]
MSLTLVIGSKNYSSWSLRAWIFLKHLGIEFDERMLTLYSPEFYEEIGKISPARRVPVLLDGDLRIWDSLAICEYLAEKTGRGWPKDTAARAHARAISAEMHSGFQALRDACPFNARARNRHVPRTPELLASARRIDQLWEDCRRRFGRGGPWLVGEYSIVDAMYAPVVLRFNTYGADLSAPSRDYANTVLADPPLVDWLRAAESEPHRVEAIDAIGR